MMKVRLTKKKENGTEIKAEAELQASQGLQVSALSASRGKTLVSCGNEKVPKPPLMWRLCGKNVREMLFHLGLVCLSGTGCIPNPVSAT